MWWLIGVLAWGAPEMIPEGSLDLLGRTAPVFEAPLLDGGTFSLEDQRGSAVVLSFWASWCGPCRRELPALSALQAERDDVRVFAVNVDRDPAKAERFLSQLAASGKPVALPVVWDSESRAMGQYQVPSMPTMFLIDARGTVKFKKTGFSTQKGLSELEAALAGLEP